MKKFNMERIFKRSQKNKESYFGVELYAWPLMFFTTHDDTIEINILYESDDKRQKLAEEMLAECNTEHASLVRMWNMAVLSFYGDSLINNPFKKDIKFAIALLNKIHRREKELLGDSMHKLYVYKQLYDFRTYIYRHNILKEISWNLKFINDKTDYPLHMIFNAKCPEYGLLSEFPALDIEDGWHFSIGHNKNWHELDNFYFPYDGIFKLYAYDETGRKDNDFFKHLCINNSVVGGWCILLFLEGFFHVTVDRFMNNKYYFCPYVKTEEEIMAMCKSGCTIDLHRPDTYLPYGDSTMIDENQCRIDIVFKRYLRQERMYKRIHATIILENNRLVGVALKIVNNSINTKH